MRVDGPSRLLADKRGAVVIELALIAPVLALCIAGIVDMSNAYSKKLALEQGAQRAIEKIMNTTEDATVESTLADEAECQINGSTTSDGVTTCKSSPTQTITVTWRLDCTSGGTTTSQSTTVSGTYDTYVHNCTGKKAGYVEVTVSDKYSPLFPIHFRGYNSSDHSYHISATAGVRTL
jgi:Flp pilus assembly protein TadG